MPWPRGQEQRGTDELVELAVGRIGAQGDGIAEHEASWFFYPLRWRVIASALGSAPAAAEDARARSSRGSLPGLGTPRPRAGISAIAAAALCSISIQLPIGQPSSARSLVRSNGSVSIRAWCSHCGSSLLRGGAPGLG